MLGLKASFEPLRERPFRLLFLGRTLSSLATRRTSASWIGVETTLAVSAALIALALAGVLAVRDFRELRPVVGSSDA